MALLVEDLQEDLAVSGVVIQQLHVHRYDHDMEEPSLGLLQPTETSPILKGS